METSIVWILSLSQLAWVSITQHVQNWTFGLNMMVKSYCYVNEIMVTDEIT